MNSLADIVEFSYRMISLPSSTSKEVLREQPFVNILVADLLANEDIIAGSGLSLIEEYSHILLESSVNFQAVYQGLFAILTGKEALPTTMSQPQTNSIFEWTSKLHLSSSLISTIAAMFCTAPGFNISESGWRLQQFVGYLLKITSRVNQAKNMMLRVSAVNSLNTLERRFPGLLVAALGQIYVLAEKENSFVRQYYLSLVLLVLEHAISSSSRSLVANTERLLSPAQRDDDTEPILELPLLRMGETLDRFEISEDSLRTIVKLSSNRDRLSIEKVPRLNATDASLRKDVKRCFSLFIGSSTQLPDMLFSSWIRSVALIAQAIEIPTSEFRVLQSLPYTYSAPNMHVFLLLSDFFTSTGYPTIFDMNDVSELRPRMPLLLRDAQSSDAVKSLYVNWICNFDENIQVMFGALLPTPFDSVRLVNIRLRAVPRIIRIATQTRGPQDPLSVLDYFALNSNLDFFVRLPAYSAPSQMYFENVVEYIRELRGESSAMQRVWTALTGILESNPKFIHQVLDVINQRLMFSINEPDLVTVGRFLMSQMLSMVASLPSIDLPTFFPVLANVAAMADFDAAPIIKALFRYVASFEANAEVLDICRTLLVTHIEDAGTMYTSISQLLLICSLRMSDIGIKGLANFYLRLHLHMDRKKIACALLSQEGALEAELGEYSLEQDSASLIDNVVRIKVDGVRTATIYRNTPKFLVLEKNVERNRNYRLALIEEGDNWEVIELFDGIFEKYEVSVREMDERSVPIFFDFSYAGIEGNTDEGGEDTAIHPLYSVKILFGDSPFYKVLPPVLVPYLCRNPEQENDEVGTAIGFPYRYLIELPLLLRCPIPTEIDCFAKFNGPDGTSYVSDLNKLDISLTDIALPLPLESVFNEEKLKEATYTEFYRSFVSKHFKDLWDMCLRLEDSEEAVFSFLSEDNDMKGVISEISCLFGDYIVDVRNSGFDEVSVAFVMFLPPRYHVLMKGREKEDAFLLDICTDYWAVLPFMKAKLSELAEWSK